MCSKVLLTILLLVLLGNPSFAAIAVDTATGSSTTGTSLTFSHTSTGTGTTGLLLVGCGIGTGGGTTVSGITYNSVALTQLQTLTNSSDYRVDLWYLKLPATGAHNVVVDITNSLGLTCHSLTLTGVDQATTFGTKNTATGTNSAPSVTVTTATGQVIVDVVVWGATNVCGAVGANQTERDTCRGVASSNATDMSTQNGADGGVMSWAKSGAGSWGMIAVPVLPDVPTTGIARRRTF